MQILVVTIYHMVGEGNSQFLYWWSWKRLYWISVSNNYNLGYYVKIENVYKRDIKAIMFSLYFSWYMALIQNVIDPRPTMEYTLIYFLICINDKFMLVSKGIYLTELLKVNFVNHRMFAKNIFEHNILEKLKKQEFT